MKNKINLLYFLYDYYKVNCSSDIFVNPERPLKGETETIRLSLDFRININILFTTTFK